MKALQVFAGPRALVHLRERRLQPADVRVVAAAAGGPKGLVLNPLDRFLFGSWLAASGHPVHLLGASIGSWRMACATLPDPVAALQALAHDYIHQRFDVPDGEWPHAAEVSRVVGLMLTRLFGGQFPTMLAHDRYHLHVFTSRGRGRLLARDGNWRTALGYGGAFAANLVGRQHLAHWLERVVFSDPRQALPFALTDFRSRQVGLTEQNLAPALRASGAIPFVLQAEHNIPGAPPGVYWDGGITDYHLHLNFSAMTEGLVLYPHFQQALVPGWLDKGLRRRHASTAYLDNVIVMAPHPDWVRQLPGGKLPDRDDFKTFRHDIPGRIQRWSQAVSAAQQLADEAADWLAAPVQHALPL